MFVKYMIFSSLRAGYIRWHDAQAVTGTVDKKKVPLTEQPKVTTTTHRNIHGHNGGSTRKWRAKKFENRNDDDEK